MKSRVGAALLAVAATAGISLAAAPAYAGAISFGGKQCVQGSIVSSASGDQNVNHEHRRNGVYYRKTFSNGITIKSNTYYPGISGEDAASIQNGTGTLQNPVRNCSD